MGKDLEIEKLKGIDNYHDLIYRSFEKCIDPDESNRETDASKLKSCRAIMALGVDTSLYKHIRNCTTPLEIYSTFKRLFDDNGLTRETTLLRSLISTKLNECENMQDYIDRIINCVNRLNGIGFEVCERWKKAIILTGLSEKYQPFIMTVEASTTQLNSDQIIAKLLDQESPSNSGETETVKGAFVALYSNGNRQGWYVHSGGSSNMTPTRELLSDVKKCQSGDITTANNSKMAVEGIGNRNMKLDGMEIAVSDILHVPKLSVNILSVSKMVKMGNTVLFDKNGCTIKNANGAEIAQCKEKDGVYPLYEDSMKCMSVLKNNDAFLWHRKLGHLNINAMKKMRNEKIGLSFQGDETRIKNREICARGKMTRVHQ
ncbi:uncharacterized protein LOC116348083 [Contarinia nasturtii]|uniref:uncharacterized protein LOC116348083 n=1 Tax=Contarinia nasturtii TaxID=265458 RepID=UPI0012D3CE39|nr:uncharacterized protein LOC116348083 [Contarinia nasturtii]